MIPELHVAGDQYFLPVCVYLDENPRVMFGKRTTQSPLRAWVCGDCGYTELYATQVKRIVSLHQRIQQKQRKARDQPETGT